MISEAICVRQQSIHIHKSIIVYINHSFGFCQFSIDVYGNRVNDVMSIESDKEFLYIHADQLHEEIIKTLRLVSREVQYLLS